MVLPRRESLTEPFAHNEINNTLKIAIRGQDASAFTLHDLRLTASTLQHESGWLLDLVENALSYTIGGLCWAYNRAA